MKLSEEMRLGAMATKQAFGCLAKANSANEVVATCAFGAAQFAVGGIVVDGDDDVEASVYVRHQGILDPIVTCPACSYRRQTWRIIHHLNDNHRWTREDIARFVKTIEDAQTPPDPSCGRSEVAPEKVAPGHSASLAAVVVECR